MRHGRAGVLAASVVAAAWLVGSTALAVLGLGLGLAALAARAWADLAGRGLSVEVRPAGRTPVEGEPLRLDVGLRGRHRLASRIEWSDTIGPLGERTVDFAGAGRVRLVLDGAPRGRYRLGRGTLRAYDPLGLSYVERTVDQEESFLVRPRVPVLATLFTDVGAWGEGGRRTLLRRPSGLEPHGVREYVEGEPLRGVHWPTSARRGELMVRELEDAPRDSVAVVLDVEAGAVAGPPGSSSLDDAARAAAGLVRAHALRSRRAALVIASPVPEVHRVRALGLDWEAALDALAGVEAATGAPLPQLVAARGSLGHVPEVVVVTARPEAVADALAARAAVGRSTALVAIDAPTYAGLPPTEASPTLLRLVGAGVPVAVLRRGIPLEEALGALRVRAVG